MKNANEDKKELYNLAVTHLHAFSLLGCSDCLKYRATLPCITQAKLLPKWYRARIRVITYFNVEIQPRLYAIGNLDGIVSLTFLKFLKDLWRKTVCEMRVQILNQQCRIVLVLEQKTCKHGIVPELVRCTWVKCWGCATLRMKFFYAVVFFRNLRVWSDASLRFLCSSD